MLALYLILIFNPTTSSKTEDEILKFLGKQYFQKLFEDTNEDIVYEFTSPIVSHSSEVNFGTYQATNGDPSDAFYVIPAFGENFHIHLKSNKDLISKDFKYYTRDGNKTENLNSDFIKDCMYYGTVISHEMSSAAITTCQGLSGIIQTPKEIILIQPLPNHFRSKRHSHKDHVVFKRLNSNMKCAADEYSESLKISFLDQYKRNRFSNNVMEMKELTIEIATFIDFELYMHLSKFFIENTYESILTYLFSIINAMQLILNSGSLTDKNIRILVVRVDIMQTSNVNFRVTNDAKTYITSFCEWQETLNVADDKSDKHWDIALMLTGLDLFYEGNACAGLTPLNGMCLKRYSCTLSEGKGFLSVFIITHELGHAFGLRHDGDSNNCNPKKYIMSSNTIPTVTSWSSCSRAYFHEFLKKQFSVCLQDSGEEKTDLNHEKDHNILLGQKYDVDFQCQIEHGKMFLHDRNQKLENICKELICNNGFISLTGLPAYEGSLCKKGFWCKNNQCVEKPRNVLELPSGIWSNYTEFSKCNGPCILKGTGIATWERTCINERKENMLAHCQGSRFIFDMCSDHLICRRRKSIQYEALTICRNISQTLEIPFQRGGKQELNDETGGCQVWCLGMDNEYQTWKTYFPDGTPCGDKKFCVRGKCADFYCSNSIQDPNISSCLENYTEK